MTQSGQDCAKHDQGHCRFMPFNEIYFETINFIAMKKINKGQYMDTAVRFRKVTCLDLISPGNYLKKYNCVHLGGVQLDFDNLTLSISFDCFSPEPTDGPAKQITDQVESRPL